MRQQVCSILGIALMVGAACSAAHGNQPKDWPAILREDAQAFHDLIGQNHPGPANTLDPRFTYRNYLTT